jgi:hypothetical protein
VQNPKWSGCRPCVPPRGTEICEFAPKGSRSRGAHKAGGPRDCDHCKYWKVNQQPYPYCDCFWGFDRNEDNCKQCPPGLGSGPPSGNPGGGGKAPPSSGGVPIA